jgi:oligopeptide transport system substrate-binding protein
MRRGWIGDYGDPNTFLELFTGDSGNNNTHWKNARFDELILKLAPSERDPAKRAALMMEAEQILLDEAPCIPIYFYIKKNLIRPSVKGVYENILDVHPPIVFRALHATGAAP